MSCNAKSCPAQIIKITDDLCEQWDCEWRKPKTNGDRIRSMSDEELAKFMALNTDCYYCRAKDNDRCASLATTPCDDIWLDWLKREVDPK